MRNIKIIPEISKKLGYILSVILLLVSTRTSGPSRSYIFVFLMLCLVVFVFKFKKFKLDSFFGKYCIFMFLLILSYTVYFRSFNPQFSVSLFQSGLIAYFVLKMLGRSFFDNLSHIIYLLALISLPLFLIQQFYYEDLHTINNFLEANFNGFQFGGDYDSNSIIYSMKDNARTRNSGFMWEPGAFAAFLSIGILFNLLRTNMKLEYRTMIMVIAMVTTFSTMGYIALLFIYIFYIGQSQKHKSILFLPLIVTAVFLVWRLDFMAEKIATEFNNIDNVSNIAFSSSLVKHERVSLGRMGSLILDFKDFLRYPVLGVGGEFEAKSRSFYTNFNRTNGWGNYLVTFGLIGVILFFYNMTKSFKLIFFQYSTKAYHAGIIVILIITFSNHILTQPLFLGLQLYHFIGIKYDG